MKIWAVIIALMMFAVHAEAAEGYVFGAQDHRDPSDQALDRATALHARTWRIIIDPSRSLDEYEATVTAVRTQGMRPQLVIGGIGTSRNYDLKKAAEVTVAAFKRWSDAFTVSFINEPDLYGVAACDYSRYFRQVYSKLKSLGATVLVGELSPIMPMRWMRKLAKCGRLTADGFAWHPYDWKPFEGSIGAAPAMRLALAHLRPNVGTPRGYGLPLYATEYGTPSTMPDSARIALWGRALRIAQEAKLSQIVIYQLTASGADSKWDTSPTEDVFEYLRDARNG
jgi:hypothetical protein